MAEFLLKIGKTNATQAQGRTQKTYCNYFMLAEYRSLAVILRVGIFGILLE